MAENKDEAAEDPKLKALEKQLNEIQRAFSGVPEQLWPDDSKTLVKTTRGEQELTNTVTSSTDRPTIPPKYETRTQHGNRECRERLANGYGKCLIAFAVSWTLIRGYDWPLWPIGAFCFFSTLAIIEAGSWVFTKKTSPWLAQVLLTAALLTTGYYFVQAYNKIESDFRGSEKWVVPPAVDHESVSEIGYIYDEKRTIDFKSWLQNRRIKWWVKVSSTNRIYSCDWESGFSNFSKNDRVELIHKKSNIDTNIYSGFIVGVSGKQRGRSAAVWAVDVEDIEELILN
jgi:hypothetical protein